jgi:hypothetical protein
MEPEPWTAFLGLIKNYHSAFMVTLNKYRLFKDHSSETGVTDRNC